MASINQMAPELELDQWVQGEGGLLAAQRGNVVLIEVFQVNCPGCFIAGLPEAIEVFNQFQGQPVVVWGMATGFEDFDKNNLENLQRLLSSGEVTGDTLSSLGEAHMLNHNRLQYEIPFPVAWDRLLPTDGIHTEESVQKIIARDILNFDSLPENTQDMLKSQIQDYFQKKKYSAATFDRYELRGTPSSILIDKKGVLREKLFGSGLGLENYVTQLLDE
jgi:hypothetical protein